MYIYIYIYTCVIAMCIHVYIYIYIERERGRERERLYILSSIAGRGPRGGLQGLRREGPAGGARGPPEALEDRSEPKGVLLEGGLHFTCFPQSMLANLFPLSFLCELPSLCCCTSDPQDLQPRVPRLHAGHRRRPPGAPCDGGV